MTYDLTEEVKALSSLNFEGNIIPLEWFQYLKFNNGKPDTNAILILSDIIYWYRPTIFRDELSGRITGYKKKFKADILQRGYKEYENLFGLSPKQVREALIRLENLTIIKRVFRTIQSNNTKLSNVMFIQIFPKAIEQITNKLPNYLQGNTSLLESKDLIPLKETPLSAERNTYTETTTKITTNNSLSLSTTKNDSSLSKEIVREKEMINIWDKIIREGEKPSVHSKSRLVILKKVLQEFFESNLTNWENYCLNIKKSNFLMGGGASNWKADLTWAIRSENLIRVLEGYYHQKEGRILENNNEELTEETEEICDDIVWNKVKEILKIKRGEGTYKSWFKQLSLKGYEDNKVLLVASTKFIREWIINNYHGDIIDSFKQANSQIKELEIFVKDRDDVLGTY